jgi:hypothetical protein
MLQGRESIADLRARRERVAQALWGKAHMWSRRVAQLPFVRMVALTGSLAVGNVEPGADIDYLIVTAPDRLWVCRAAVIALTRWAARYGDVICPNYFVSERALAIRERNLYTAREFAQMIPLQGMSTYRRMCTRNTWVRGYLPNAQGAPTLSAHICVSDSLHPDARSIPRALAEAILQTPPGNRLEQWEMQRKLRKFHTQREAHLESSFGPDCCKGHFGDHMTRTLHAFAQRVQQVRGESGAGWLERMSDEPAAIGVAALAA